MASLNLSANGPAIKSSYQKVVDSTPSGPASSSPTYSKWVAYTIQTPLNTTFQADSGKESVLKVQSTGEGELVDLIDEFSEGRIQFAFVKVKDSNSGLPKSVLIAWCGEGVPERTKGYFTSHLTAVSKLLHGYHVQITARSDRDLTPESIIQKVGDASGARYGGGAAESASSGRPVPPVTSKPVFMPSQTGASSGFNPLGSRSRQTATNNKVDSDGWGEDAPQITRSQLEKVDSAYKPTKVNMAELTSQQGASPRAAVTHSNDENGDVVRGGYQPVGKIDIAAMRRQAQEQGHLKDDRPTIVKGSYEPIGKVDIAAIRAKAQGGSQPLTSTSTQESGRASTDNEQQQSLSDRSAAFQQQQQPERLTSMPKPKIANKFGDSTTFSGTKAPSPGGFGQITSPSAASVTTASRSFADQGGKTPAQLWAEKKARERGNSNAGEVTSPSLSQTSPVTAQKSGGWQGGYSGKKWNAVQITKTGTSTASAEQDEQDIDREQPISASSTGVGSMAQRFNQSNTGPPTLDVSSKPSTSNQNAERAMPGLPPRPPINTERPDEEHVRIPTPPQQPRSPSPEPTSASSPIRVAMPVSRLQEPAPIETSVPAPLPVRSLAQAAKSNAFEAATPSEEKGEDLARAMSQQAATSTFGAAAVQADPRSQVSGKTALALYDYEKAEDNEIGLRDGEKVIDIDMVDEDWWMGKNEKGEVGLFPANYVELVENGSHADNTSAPVHTTHDEEINVNGQRHDDAQEHVGERADGETGSGKTVTAEYDYEAGEDNEISFPEGAKITDVEFPDDDWWLGTYNGKRGLFPANYVQLIN